MLEALDLSVYYGSVRALDGVTFDVNEAEIVSFVGPNGAGKSTALKAVCGLLSIDGGLIAGGTISYGGMQIAGVSTDRLARKGLCLVPEGRRVFPTMTVQENLEMGGYTLNDGPLLREEMTKVFSMFPLLRNRATRKAGTLSGGEQQMLAIGRALMLRPKLLMADEPSLGLSPNFIDVILDSFLHIRAQGTSILLVEQNARLALDICDRAYVFEHGNVEEWKKAELLSDMSALSPSPSDFRGKSG